jgi:hypothetical protein
LNSTGREYTKRFSEFMRSLKVLSPSLKLNYSTARISERSDTYVTANA